VNMPTADDLFRPTAPGPAESSNARLQGIKAVPDKAESQPAGTATARKTSGRVRHDEKMTVYVTAEELLQIESARLNLRSEHGLAVDRGRLVREAISIALADLMENGSESTVVQRLQQQ
jgi:hypothetical protein